MFSFIRGKYNCLVVKNGVIMNAFKERNELLQKGIEEIFPVRLKHSKEEPGNVKEYVKQNFSEFGNLYQKEVLFRVGLNEDDNVEGNEGLINEEFETLRRNLTAPKYIFYSKEDDIKTSLMELEHIKGFKKKEFD